MDLSDPEIIERYFQYYFYQRDHLMAYPCRPRNKKENLLDLLGANQGNIARTEGRMLRQSFATAANCFAAIDAETQGILVPYGEGRRIIEQLCSWQPENAAALSVQRELLKKAQRYSVNLYPDALKKLGNAVACIPETGIMYLPESYYDTETGVTAEATGEMDFLHY